MGFSAVILLVANVSGCLRHLIRSNRRKHPVIHDFCIISLPLLLVMVGHLEQETWRNPSILSLAGLLQVQLFRAKQVVTEMTMTFKYYLKILKRKSHNNIMGLTAQYADPMIHPILHYRRPLSVSQVDQMWELLENIKVIE